MTAVEQDVVRAFLNALSPAARDHLARSGGYQQNRLIHAACARHDPAELARTVSAGITRTHPANAPGLLLYRLRRAAGQLDERPEENPA